MSDRWFAIGHKTLAEHGTGCTAIIFDKPVPAAGDVRGGAPGTRETALLDPASPGYIDGLTLSGGSAFGLRTADGVMEFLVEHGRGFPAPAGPVPRVPAAVIYDLASRSDYSPTAADGYAAARAAFANNRESGPVGAGTGATVAKLSGQPGTPAGLSIADDDAGLVTAMVIVNAVGDIIDPASGSYLAKTSDPLSRARSGRDQLANGTNGEDASLNTTIGAIMVDRPMDRHGLARCCIAAHDALARCVVPAHTALDGDTFFAVAENTGPVSTRDLLQICCSVELAMERAITDLFVKQTPVNDPEND